MYPFIYTHHCRNQGYSKTKLQAAKDALQKLKKRKYDYDFLLELARRTNFNTEALIRIAHRCRTSRRILLYGANENLFAHPVMFLKLHLVAYKLLRQMEVLFEQIFIESGNEIFIEEISEAKFITPQYIQRVREARQNYLESTHMYPHYLNN